MSKKKKKVRYQLVLPDKSNEMLRYEQTRTYPPVNGVVIGIESVNLKGPGFK